MRRTLLVTNDFPPRAGGIQSYLHEIAKRVPGADLMVYAPAWKGAAEFDARQPFEVVRHPTSLMVPEPRVAKLASELVRAHRADTVWFGAAAPLALLAPHLRRAGAEHSVASTHGHEVGWSMLPGARQALRRIGSTTSILTYVSKYTRSRFAGAFGPQAALEYLPSGVDSTVFAPDPAARAELRRRYGLGERPVIVCVSRLVPRKGQDQLIRALPEIRESVDGATLLIVGGGPYRDRLTNLASQVGVSDHVIITGSVPFDELPGHYNVGDVFAMPCRTRGGGLDVEGLGIVFLEASACGLPVIAGDSGGAPETVQEGHTGHVVPGTDPKAIAAPIVNLLANPATAQKMGQAGRAWIQSDWSWDHQAARMTGFLGR